MRGFVEALDFCSLKDVRFTGPRFTWSGIRAGHVIKIRLDKFVATDEWLNYFAASKVHHLNPNKSDHIPILLEVRRKNEEGRKNKRRFRYEACWNTNASCMDIVSVAWGTHGGGGHVDSLLVKLRKTREALIKWNREELGSIPREIESTRAHLAQFYIERSTYELEEKISEEIKLANLLQQEELFWKQRSKSLWLMEGESSTKYFHRVASERKNFNTIGGLFDEVGRWQDKETTIQKIVLDYFCDLFTSSSCLDVDIGGQLMEKVITEEQNAILEAGVTKDEIFKALSMMHPSKSPGPDGFSSGFFQKHWNIVGDTVVNSVRCFLSSDDCMRKVNDTLVVLIPKVPTPERMQQLRPISLCNVIYKIGSKVLANRLKPIMDGIISPQQGAFVPGRAITDNSHMPRCT